MGIYIDNYSRDVETRGNTVINTTVSGILYQRSSGMVISNTVFNASSGTEFSAQIDLGGSQTQVTMSENALYGLKSNAWTLYSYNLSNILSSDYNTIFQPYVNQHIAYGPSWTRYTFAGWQAFSGQEGHSVTHWFTQASGETSRGIIFYNPTKFPQLVQLGSRQYLDLGQIPVSGSFTLQPFSSKILVDNGPAPLTLLSIHPTLSDVDEATDFTLTLTGYSFTIDSLVRWNGSNRPTTYFDPTRLTAEISTTDVSALGAQSVTVWDPEPPPGGTETAPVTFYVVASVTNLYIPHLVR
jgi:parallel beta-helix repeat protein